MSIHELFRLLFGLRHGEHTDNLHRDDSCSDDANERDELQQPGFNFRGIGNLDDMFRHFHGDMEQQMEEIQRQMEDMFKNFGRTEFSALPPSHGASDDSLPDNKGNLRDRMLKKPGCEDDPSHDHRGFSFVDIIPAVPRWSRQLQVKLDSDLDETVKQAADLNKLFEPRKGWHGDAPGTVVPKQDFPESSFRSVSISTIRRPDGSIEQKRTTRDSRGTEETTVTRSLGDQVHTETAITGPSGERSDQETYTNMDDEKDKAWFEKAWRRRSSSSSSSAIPDAFLKEQPSLPSTQQENRLNESIFHKFFGFSLPSTSKIDS